MTAFVVVDSLRDQWFVVPGVGRYGLTDAATAASLLAMCGQTTPASVSDAFLNLFPVAT